MNDEALAPGSPLRCGRDDSAIPPKKPRRSRDGAHDRSSATPDQASTVSATSTNSGISSKFM